MILAATAADFAALRDGRAPRGFRLPDSPIASPPVLGMLAELADSIALVFAPAAWLIVEDGEVVGLCSITRMPLGNAVNIGYGVAPTRQSRGSAGRAVGDIVAWARTDARIHRLTAETTPDNTPSQRVLERNGFLRCGERHDPEDGLVICWQVTTS